MVLLSVSFVIIKEAFFFPGPFYSKQCTENEFLKYQIQSVLLDSSVLLSKVVYLC